MMWYEFKLVVAFICSSVVVAALFHRHISNERKINSLTVTTNNKQQNGKHMINVSGLSTSKEKTTVAMN